MWVILASSSVVLSPQTLLSVRLIWSPHTAAPMLPVAIIEGVYITKLWSKKTDIRQAWRQSTQENLPPVNQQSSLQTMRLITSSLCERVREGREGGRETARGDLNAFQRVSHLLRIQPRTPTLHISASLPFLKDAAVITKTESRGFGLHPSSSARSHFWRALQFKKKEKKKQLYRHWTVKSKTWSQTLVTT